ncbi:hypothetical protein MHU86_14527 [Fragilaria crotonensis]|nr:hypothetical protein MHU86_14527 [Fragilaria crotonensis]
MGSPEVLKWINLLAVDVVSRVQQDMDRNCRYPKSCSVQYTVSQKVGAEARSKDRTTKSIRIPFPNQHEKDKQGILAVRANDSILQREGTVFLHRIGLCAMEFETRVANGGIASFFGKKSNSTKLPSMGISPVAAIEEKSVGDPSGESVVFNVDSGLITNDNLIEESKLPLVDPECQQGCGAAHLLVKSEHLSLTRASLESESYGSIVVVPQ